MTLFWFIDAEKANLPVSRLCHVLGVSRSGYYAWTTRGPSNRVRRDRVLIRYIRQCHDDSRHTYGAARIHADLRLHHDIRCGKKRVARLMRREGIVGVQRRRLTGCTHRDTRRPVSDDLVARNFARTAINRLWVADITQHPTDEGWLYAAIVQDTCSRRIVGWAMDDHLRAELVVAALNMAVARRKPKPGLVVHHSDHGSQYTSAAFDRALKRSGIQGSMGTVGDALDNAMAESFNATLQTELLNTRPSWPTRHMLKSAVFDYIEVFYNRHRRHSALGFLSPLAYEDSLKPGASDAG